MTDKGTERGIALVRTGDFEEGEGKYPIVVESPTAYEHFESIAIG